MSNYNRPTAGEMAAAQRTADAERRTVFLPARVGVIVAPGDYVSIPTDASGQHTGTVVAVRGLHDTGRLSVTLRYWDGTQQTVTTSGKYVGYVVVEPRDTEQADHVAALREEWGARPPVDPERERAEVDAARERSAARRSVVKTTYLGPTDTRGSRIRARYMGRTLTTPYDYAARDPHASAAAALARAVHGRDVTLTAVDYGQRGNTYRVEI